MGFTSMHSIGYVILLLLCECPIKNQCIIKAPVLLVMVIPWNVPRKNKPSMMLTLKCQGQPIWLAF
jgi:hypothetical protein